MFVVEQCKGLLRTAEKTEFNPRITAEVLAELKEQSDVHDAAMEEIASSTDVSKQVELRKKVSSLSTIAEAFHDLDHALKELKESHAMTEEMRREEGGPPPSPELTEAMAMEAEAVEAVKESEWNALRMLIRLQEAKLSSSASDIGARNVILEVRAGSGGAEAALFAVELLAMYRSFAAAQGWLFEVLSEAETSEGGYREATAALSCRGGAGVFEQLQFEQGVHRVQRVPATESLGRVHTSTVTVAVLPEAEDVDIDLNPSDLKIDVYRASGAGGQHVNTTESAVRITHLPSGLVVAIQDERSQHKNKEKALKLLRARLYEIERSRLAEERSKMRMGQIGTGGRSERIRTYNFPQGRVTDHRSNVSVFDMEKMLNGEHLEEIIDGLQEIQERERVDALLAAYAQR